MVAIAAIRTTTTSAIVSNNLDRQNLRHSVSTLSRSLTATPTTKAAFAKSPNSLLGTRPSFAPHSANQPPTAAMLSASPEHVFPSLVSVDWLHAHLDTVKILDATWYMPVPANAGKDAIAEFCNDRIPGAQFFDLDDVADHSSDLPHMLPSPEVFSAAADALGITNDDVVVIYDRVGMFSSPRAWWTWRVAGGHQNVTVLDGGLPAWKAAGYEVDNSPRSSHDAVVATKAAEGAAIAKVGECEYKANPRNEQVRSWQQVLDNIETQREVVVDARPAARWRGEAPEPRPGLAKGGIPGSFNVPWDTVQREGKMKPIEELKEVFSAAGVDTTARLVASCGSGTTAAILALAVNQLPDNAGPVAIYDGSWSEWGGKEELPKIP